MTQEFRTNTWSKLTGAVDLASLDHRLQLRRASAACGHGRSTRHGQADPPRLARPAGGDQERHHHADHHQTRSARGAPCRSGENSVGVRSGRPSSSPCLLLVFRDAQGNNHLLCRDCNPRRDDVDGSGGEKAVRPRRSTLTLLLSAVMLTLPLSRPAGLVAGEQPAESGLAARLRELDARVFPADGATAKALPGMLVRDVRARIQASALRENAAWHAARTRADWERVRDARIRALRESLGPLSTAPPVLKDASHGPSKETDIASRTWSSRAARGWW